MKDLIGNNAKFVLDYGQLILGVGVIIGLFIIYWIGRNNRFFLPKTIPGWIGSVFSVIVIAILLLAIYGLQFEKNTTGKVLNQIDTMVAQEAPPLTFKNVVDDTQVKLSDYEGKVVLLNIWATWCAPCVKELPEFDKLQNDFGKDGLVVITLSDEPRDKLLKFNEKHPYSYMSVYNRQIEWIDSKIGTARPMTFIIDKEGTITAYFTGVRNYGFYAPKVRELL